MRISISPCERLMSHMAKGYDKLALYKRGRMVTDAECAFLKNLEEGLEVMETDVSMNPGKRKDDCCDDFLEDYERKYQVDEDRQAEREGSRMIEAAFPQNLRPKGRSKSYSKARLDLDAFSAAAVKRKAPQSGMGSIHEHEDYEKAMSNRPRRNPATSLSAQHGSDSESEVDFYET